MNEPIAKNAERDKAEPVDEVKKCCGIIMPIAAMDNYPVEHWMRVRAVLDSAIIDAGYQPRIVSDGEDNAVIHANIVQNLAEDEIVVCDVSGKNPNVMFELGLRLAFDKPTIIVKDDVTGYNFDTSPIKHIPYRKDQRFDDVARFQQEVSEKIEATIKAKQENPDYSPFVAHFTRKVPKQIGTKEVPQFDFMMDAIERIEKQMQRMMTNAATGKEGNIVYKTTGAVGMNTKSVSEIVAKSMESKLIEKLIRSVIDGCRPISSNMSDADREGIIMKCLHELKRLHIIHDTAEFQEVFWREFNRSMDEDNESEGNKFRN